MFVQGVDDGFVLVGVFVEDIVDDDCGFLDDISYFC